MERLGEGRLGWQSRVLVWVCVPVSLYAARGCFLLNYSCLLNGSWCWKTEWQYAWEIYISIFFAAIAAISRSASIPAALTGGLFCFVLITLTSDYTQNEFNAVMQSGLFALIALFILTSTATRWRRARKQFLGVAEARRGRNANQVVANLFIGCIAAKWFLPQTTSYMALAGTLASLSALAEATADTVSSEVGQGFGGRTWMLTTLKPVEVGVDGGVSLMGTLAGLVGAALVVVTGAVAMGLGWKLAGTAFVGAVVGLFFDSLMGATVERWGWVNNDVVNFSSTLVSALVAGVILLL